MVKIFWPNQEVPTWLQAVRPMEGYENDCVLNQPTFKSIVFVWKRDGYWMIYNPVPYTYAMSISSAKNAIFDGLGCGEDANNKGCCFVGSYTRVLKW